MSALWTVWRLAVGAVAARLAWRMLVQCKLLQRRLEQRRSEPVPVHRAPTNPLKEVREATSVNPLKQAPQATSVAASERLSGSEDIRHDYQAEVTQGLVLARLAGGGRIACEECGYTAIVVSFTHGSGHMGDYSETGYQCQACGAFETLYERGADSGTEVLRCQCGGVLSRLRVLWCPKCRSRKLRYTLLYLK